jgi:hypothetical protein
MRASSQDVTLIQTSAVLRIPFVRHPRQKQYQKEYLSLAPGGIEFACGGEEVVHRQNRRPLHAPYD